MLIEIDPKRAELALQIASKIAEKKSGVDVTSNVLLSATDKLTIKATNLQVNFTADITCAVQKEGDSLVSAFNLYKFIAKYDETLTFKSDKNHLHILGKTSKHKIAGGAVSNFPKVFVEGRCVYTLNSKIFAELLKATTYLVGENLERHFLEGIRVEIKGNTINFASSDSVRLASATYVADEPFLVSSVFTIPRHVLTELPQLLANSDQISFGLDEDKLYFKSGNFNLSCSQLAHKYPDISGMFLPEKDLRKIEFDKAEFLTKIGRTTIVSDKISLVNSFKFTKTQLNIEVTDADNSSQETIEIESEDEFETHFRINQVRDFLTAISSNKFLFVYNEKKKPFELREINSKYSYKYLLLPMTIQ